MTTDLRTIADLEAAVDKLVAPLGLHLAASTWKHQPEKPVVVTLRLESITDQLTLFGGDRA